LALTVALSFYLYGRLHLVSLKTNRLENTVALYQRQVEKQASEIKLLTEDSQMDEADGKIASIEISGKKTGTESLLPDSGPGKKHSGDQQDQSREKRPGGVDTHTKNKNFLVEKAKDNTLAEDFFRVSFSNLQFFQKSSGDFWELHFKFENKSRKTLKGYIFAIIKPDDEDLSTWFSLPSTTLIDKKPDQFKKGRYFSISNYKTIRFEVKDRPGLETVQKCAIFVYAANGNLMASKEFEIKNE
jgi:hypothetical protein